ncbi:murein L,D-transpeptidase family protein [Marinobacter sp.]|uniref:murein L,D-transpeptidase family protein n=1 Tax=Marinobacter sp. TaxID=50741 RepID=UPI0034A16DDA
MKVRNSLILFIFAACLLAPLHGASATELLARAETEMPASQPAAGLPAGINKVLVRKSERRLYLMDDDQVVKSYRISLGENPEGHKLYEGDQRTPEGDYELDWRNADSDFYKSIHISYPNVQDRELASAWGLDPGGSIMIHGLPNEAGDLAFAYIGLDWTNGCIAVTNDQMDEIWTLVHNGTPIRILP